MKILFVSDIYSIHTARWVNALTERGHDVHLASRAPAKPLVHSIDRRVIVSYIGGRRRLDSFLSAPALRKLYKQTRPDVVNVHYASSYGLMGRLARIHPLLLNVWGSDVYEFPYKSGLNRKLLVGTLKKADLIASTSHVMADQVRTLLGNPNLEIPVTPFGVDLNRFKPVGLKKEKSEIVIGTVKSLHYKYGIEDSIKAFRLLMDKLRIDAPETPARIRYHIYGEGPLKEELETLIRTLNLESHVFLKGVIANEKLPAVMEKMDVVCLSSVVRESFGVSAVEAMAMEIPVVAADAEGYREVVADGVTGILVPQGDPEAIAKALARLILDPKLRHTMGRKGRERVQALYDWNKNVDGMLEIYRTLAFR